MSSAKGPIQQLLDALPFYVILVDSGHNIVAVNQRVTRDFKVSPQHLIGAYPSVLWLKPAKPERLLKENCSIQESGGGYAQPYFPPCLLPMTAGRSICISHGTSRTIRIRRKSYHKAWSITARYAISFKNFNIVRRALRSWKH
ncbi:MAG: hypothetical protein ABSC60_14815 [Acidobacteriota bacterium]